MNEKKLLPKIQTIFREQSREKEKEREIESVGNPIIEKYTFKTISIFKVHSVESWQRYNRWY